MIKDTSLKCYEEIQDEGIYENDMEMVYDAIKNNPLMTGREYATLILGYDDMNKVRPRITDLKNKGLIIEAGKRECSCSKRTSYVWCTLINIEKLSLKKAGFEENTPDLFKCKEGDVYCYQDFRKGSRRSYCFTFDGKIVDYHTLDCYKRFKEELNKYLGEN